MSHLIDIWGMLETIVNDKNNYAVGEEKVYLERFRNHLMLFSFVHETKFMTVEQYLNLVEEFEDKFY